MYGTFPTSVGVSEGMMSLGNYYGELLMDMNERVTTNERQDKEWITHNNEFVYTLILAFVLGIGAPYFIFLP